MEFRLKLGANMLAFISIGPSSLATKFYVIQEFVVVLLVVAILFAIPTVFLATAVFLQEAERSRIRWGKRSVHRFARKENSTRVFAFTRGTARGIWKMRKSLWTIPVLLLLTTFPSSVRADGLVPVEIVNATLFFVPLADNFENTHSSFLFVDYQLGVTQETLGVASSSDPFAISNGQMTFIPGLYDPNGNPLIIEPSSLPGGDNFSILSGLFTFTLPSTVTPIFGNQVGGLFYEIDNVPMTLSAPVPEPETFLLIGIGLVFVMGKRIAQGFL